MISSDPTLSYSNLNWLRSLDHDGALNLLRAHESNVGGDLPDLVDYMKRYNLFYICENSDSLNSAYTIQIFNQNSALIFLGAPYTGIPLVTTLVHEFGHASYICLNSNSQTCLDVMEIQSQGNEALFYAACGGYLMRGSDSMAADGISDLMYTVWTAGLWTQFELWAYEKQAEVEKQQLLADAQKQADEIVAAGKAAVEIERQNKLREADAQATALARSMCEKLLKHNLTAQDDDQLLDDLLQKAGAGNGN